VSKMPTNLLRVLFIKLSAMGDIVHAMPSAMAIRSRFPNCDLRWVVQTEFADLLKNHPAVSGIIEVPKRPSIADLMRLRKTLRENVFDFALDMQGLFKSARIIAMAKSSRKLGFQWQREGSRFFSKPIRTDAQHVVDQYLAVAAAVGADTADVSFGLAPMPSALESAKAKLQALGLQKPIVAINLGAGAEEKRWPAVKFGALAKALISHGCSPFTIGSPNERELAAQLNIPSLAGQTSIAELVGVLSLCDLHIGGDTGSVHIATALEKQVVAIMGPTRPERSGPYRRMESVVYSPSGSLASISEQELLEKALARLKLVREI